MHTLPLLDDCLPILCRTTLLGGAWHYQALGFATGSNYTGNPFTQCTNNLDRYEGLMI